MKMTSLIPLMLVASLPAHSQAPGSAQPQSVKGVVRKNLAPVSTEVLRVKLPRPVDRTLKNGLKVTILENHRVPMVMLDMILIAGPVLEPPAMPGVSKAVAAMLKQGTPSRTSRQIAEEVSELGAGLNVSADSGSPSARLTASALKENLDPLLALASDVRLVLIRLALQLVRMRALKSATPEERDRAAHETHDTHSGARELQHHERHRRLQGRRHFGHRREIKAAQ